MKKTILPVLGSLLIFAACKETAPPIDFGPKAADTSYVAAPETAQQRVIVMEEFTGVTCTNCPAGHALIKSLEDANPGRIAAIGIQAYNINQANPVDEADIKTRHDNRTQVGTSLATDVFGGVSSIPVAAVDRILTNGALVTDRRFWAGNVANRLTEPSRANVTINSTYNASTRQAFIKVRVAYTSTVAKVQKLTVALVENNVVDAQEDASTFIKDYTHQHVLRDMLTPPTGAAILSNLASKPAGQVYERTFVYTVNGDWNPDNCEIIAFVSNDEGNDKEVLQGAKTHLK